MKVEVNTNGASTQDFKFLDKIINTETERKLSKVAEAKDFVIRTACVIDGVFVLVGDYDIPEKIVEKLKNA